MRLVVASFALLALAAPQAVAAAEDPRFGALTIDSTLGQPFAATFTVDAASPRALGTLELRVADDAAYAKLGLVRDAVLDQLRFDIVLRKGRRATVRASSDAALGEPAFSLLLEARTAEARSQHEYTVLLDPADAAGDLAHQSSDVEFAYELDAYYTNVSVEIPLTGRPVPDGGMMQERRVYEALFKDSLRPRLLLLEVSVYPMPVLGTYIKEHSPETYDNFTLGSGDLNLLDGLTAGFQEPWAVSAFVGSSMKFSRPNQRSTSTNKGYMGYLVSYGAKHIRQNVLIDDDWWEFEWKLKGERAFEGEDLTWSFRLGLKSHGNPDIADTLYFGGRRTNLDYKASWLGWLENSSFEWKTELAQENLAFLRQDLVVGKRFPMKNRKWALSLDVGLVYEKDDKYTGVLFDPAADNITIVFRPNIVF